MDETKRSLSVNSKALNEAIIEMEKIDKNIEELFTKIESTMRSFHDNDIWSGNTNEAYYNRFLELQQYFPKINTSLSIFVKFLRITNSNYESAEQSINNDIDKNEINLTVN